MHESAHSTGGLHLSVNQVTRAGVCDRRSPQSGIHCLFQISSVTKFKSSFRICDSNSWPRKYCAYTFVQKENAILMSIMISDIYYYQVPTFETVQKHGIMVSLRASSNSNTMRSIEKCVLFITWSFKSHLYYAFFVSRDAIYIHLIKCEENILFGRQYYGQITLNL